MLGDIIAEACTPLLDTVTQMVRDHVIKELSDSTQIMLSTLPVDATLSGAAAVATAQFLEHPTEFVG